VASEKGLKSLLWDRCRVPFAKKPENILALAVKELDEYFSYQRTIFTIPLEMEGTKFQMQVWKNLLKIPYGKTCSYKTLASMIKNEKATRAVGTANGKNPLCIIIPCHRVISANGGIGGYSGGLEIKMKLLEFETKKDESS